jgi:hypothetical protein
LFPIGLLGNVSCLFPLFPHTFRCGKMGRDTGKGLGK